MVTIYVLKSIHQHLLYVGMTMDLDNRLKEHNAGKSKFTKAYKPWIILYSETKPDWKSARIREKYLKSAAGKRWLKNHKFIT